MDVVTLGMARSEAKKKYAPITPITAQRRYRAMRGASNLAPVNIFAIGDSMTDGQGAGLTSNRWVERLLASERVKYQPKNIAGGRGFRPPYLTSPLLQASDPPALLTGGTAATLGFGPGLGGKGVRLAVGISATYTITSGTSVDVLYQKITGANSGGTMRVTIDGVDQTTVDTSGTRKECVAVRYVFGSRGAHTVVVTSTVGYVLHQGIVEYDQDENAGIRMYEAGSYSRTTAQYAANSYANNVLSDQIVMARPSLVILALGVNDYLNQIDPATAALSRNQLITGIKNGAQVAAIPVPSIIIVALRCSTVTNPTYPYSAYLDSYNATATADPNNISVLDETQHFPNPTTDATLFSDGLHHSPLGNALDANIISQYLN
jgi:lysophospholipase L1-like esterase